MLRARGSEVIVAETGQAAVNLIAGEPVDCVLLDLGLADRDGIDVVRPFVQADARELPP